LRLLLWLAASTSKNLSKDIILSRVACCEIILVKIYSGSYALLLLLRLTTTERVTSTSSHGRSRGLLLLGRLWLGRLFVKEPEVESTELLGSWLLLLLRRLLLRWLLLRWWLLLKRRRIFGSSKISSSKVAISEPILVFGDLLLQVSVVVVVALVEALELVLVLLLLFLCLALISIV